MRPQNGTRFTLDLVTVEPEVVYRFRAEGKERLSEGTVHLATSVGTPRFESETAIPAVVARHLTALVRALWRPRADGKTEARWPRRITRWRDLDPGESP